MLNQLTKPHAEVKWNNFVCRQEREESEKESEDKGSDEDEDESGEKKEGAAGPWGKIDTPAVPVVQKPSEPEPGRCYSSYVQACKWPYIS